MKTHILAGAVALLACATLYAAPGPVWVGDARFGVGGQGILVPGVYYHGTGETSAVGLTNRCPPVIDVYWAFADSTDTVRDRGKFTLKQYQTRPFVLAQELGTALDGVEGVLVFAADYTGDGALRRDDDTCLLAEAFHVNLATRDAAYLPVWPFNATDIAPLPLFPPPPAGIGDLNHLDPSALTTLHSGVVDPPGNPGNEIVVRYAIGGGDSTRLVIWSAEPISGSHPVVATNHDGAVAPNVWLDLSNPRLNVVDVSALRGLPASFTNGVLIIRTPGGYLDTGLDGNGLAVYSVIHSPAIGAAQTIPGTAMVQ